MSTINPLALANAVSPYYQSANQANMGVADILQNLIKVNEQRKQAAAANKQKSPFGKILGGTGAGAGIGAALAAPTGGLSMLQGAGLGALAGGGLGAYSS